MRGWPFGREAVNLRPQFWGFILLTIYNTNRRVPCIRLTAQFARKLFNLISSVVRDSVTEIDKLHCLCMYIMHANVKERFNILIHRISILTAQLYCCNMQLTTTQHFENNINLFVSILLLLGTNQTFQSNEVSCRSVPNLCDTCACLKRWNIQQCELLASRTETQQRNTNKFWLKLCDSLFD